MKLVNSFLTSEELSNLGLTAIGHEVKISRHANFYSTSMEIGDNVRIDDFCILSGKIKIGSNVHISAFSALYGRYEIEISDFSGLSPRCTIFSGTDDFSGKYMVGPHLPEEYTNVLKGKVIIEKYVQLGANTIVLPDLIIGEGAVTGAMTLVNKSLESWTMYAGIPAHILKKRSKELLKFACYL